MCPLKLTPIRRLASNADFEHYLALVENNACRADSLY
jgi:hypothetical protein